MVWLIVVFAMLLVAGPVLYLLPGRREKDQQRYRMHARRLGLTVELSMLYKVESEAHERVSAGGVKRIPRIAMARYGLPQEHPLSGLPELHLVRGRTFGWQSNPEVPSTGAPAHVEALRAMAEPFLDRLPASSRGLSINSAMIWVYWQETPAEGTQTAVSDAEAGREVEGLVTVLRELRSAVAEWHRRTIS